MKRIVFMSLVLSALLFFFGCSSKINTLPELEAAKAAVAQAQEEDAPGLCPNEFQSAEMKLKQAELLFVDGEEEGTKVSAIECVNLANMARSCAEAKKKAAAEAPATVGPPEELANFKVSLYFDFNSNQLKASEAKKLGKAVGFLKKMAKEHKFYLLLEAHTDLPGATNDNLELSRRRALVARYYLVQQGMMRNRIFMRASGSETALKELGEAAKTRSKNPEWRRVDLTILFDRPTVEIQQSSNR